MTGIPIETEGTENFILRAYRDGTTFQWARETFRNSLEAGATRIEFGIEWQAVREQNVYRRTIIDNGIGMSPDELRRFFKTFGGGGKAIGAEDENFGIGAKSSLFPWNEYGVVVISRQDGIDSMIWIYRDEVDGKFMLAEEESEDEVGSIDLTSVYDPYIDGEHGVDWREVLPDWVEDHGTAIVLMGPAIGYDSILGDRNREEASVGGLVRYLNERVYEMPDDVTVRVNVVNTLEKSDWPRTPEASAAHGWRQIPGAKSRIGYHAKNVEQGTVDLAGGCRAHWFLADRAKDDSGTTYGRMTGYIAYLYDDELYDMSIHQATFRSCGVTPAAVRSRLWIIFEPVKLTAQTKGTEGVVAVYPTQGRSSLRAIGGDPLPRESWNAQFASKLPEEIQRAISEAWGETKEERIDDAAKRLADRFGKRWRALKLRRSPRGRPMLLTGPGGKPRHPDKKVRRVRTKRPGGGGGLNGPVSVGSPTSSSDDRGKNDDMAKDVPKFSPVAAENFGEEPRFIAAWVPPSPTNDGRGEVQLNIDHDVVQEFISHWVAQYPDHFAEEATSIALRAGFGDSLVCAVAHSEQARGIFGDRVEEMRTTEALSMYCLGLLPQDAMVGPVLGGVFGARKKAAA